MQKYHIPGKIRLLNMHSVKVSSWWTQAQSDTFENVGRPDQKTRVLAGGETANASLRFQTTGAPLSRRKLTRTRAAPTS